MRAEPLRGSQNGSDERHVDNHVASAKQLERRARIFKHAARAQETASQEVLESCFRVMPVIRPLVVCMANNKCSQVRAASRLKPISRIEIAVLVGQAAKVVQEFQIGQPGVREGDPPVEGTITL